MIKNRLKFFASLGVGIVFFSLMFFTIFTPIQNSVQLTVSELS